MPGINGHTPQAYNAGQWKNWEAVSGNINGTWRTGSDVYVNHNGTWKQVWVRLTAPTGNSTTLSDVTATISWTPGVGQEGFKLYRNGAFVKNVAANATSTTDVLPALNTTYTYTVSAYAGSTETEQVSCGAGVANNISKQGCNVSINRDWGYSNDTWDGNQILFNTDCINFGSLYGYEYSYNSGSTVAGTISSTSTVFGLNQDGEVNVAWRSYRTYNGTTFYGPWSDSVNVKAGRPLTRSAPITQTTTFNVFRGQTIGAEPNYIANFGTVVDSYEFREVDAVNSSLLANDTRRVVFRRPAGAGGDISIPYGSSSTSGTGDDSGDYKQGPFTNYVDGFYGISVISASSGVGGWSSNTSGVYLNYKLRFVVRNITQIAVAYSIT